MALSSLNYLIFLLFAVLVYYNLPHRTRVTYLLVVSICFYATWSSWQLGTLVFGIVGNYTISILLSQSKAINRNKWLIWGVFFNVLSFIVFRYITRIVSIFLPASVVSESGYDVSFIAPLGMSFIAFKQISYLVDIYYGTVTAERRFFHYALFVSFFPSVSMGPIDRATSFFPQLAVQHQFSYNQARDGFLLIIWGLFKKIVIADRLSIIVHCVFSSPDGFSGLVTLSAVYLSIIQLYCDFSGYTDIALGSAKFFGINLSPNFAKPLLSSSIQEFWRRWHITLSNWLNNYLFMPLASTLSRRVKSAKVLFLKPDTAVYIVAIFVTWLVSGMWHGIGWTFIVWGALHGCYLAYNHFTVRHKKKLIKKLKPYPVRAKLYHTWQVIATFHLVCLANIFFYSKSLKIASSIIKSLVKGWAEQLSSLKSIQIAVRGLGYNRVELSITLALLALFVSLELLSDANALPKAFSKPTYIRWPLYYVILFSIVFFSGTNAMSFVYLQF